MGGMTLQQSFTGGELSPALSARVDLAKYNQGCRLMRNIMTQPHGGAIKRPGFMLLDALPGEAVLLPFVFNNRQSYCLVFGEKWLRVAVPGGFVENGDGTPYQTASPYTLEQAKKLSYAQSADVLFLACREVRPHKLKRFDHDHWEFEAMTFTAPFAPPEWMTTTTTTATSYPLAYAPGAAYERRTALGEDIYTPINQNLYAAHDSPVTTSKIYFVNGARKSDGSVSPAQLVTPYTYYVTAVNEANRESEASVGASIVGPAANNWQGGDYIVLNWQPVAGAMEYRIYKSEFGGRPGYVGNATGTMYQDYNVSPVLSDGPPQYVDPFAGDDFPRTVCFFEQRLVFASSVKRPQTIWMSRSGDYENFSMSVPLKDDDSLEMTLAGNEVSSACWMIALRSLVMGTTGMEWEFSSTNGPFTTKTAKATPQSYRGSMDMHAIVVDNAVLHVARSGNSVRDFKYDFGSDSYLGVDRSILAEHLFRSRTLVSWTYQPAPASVVWAVRDDGMLLGMTFQQEHEIFAWHRHDTQGTFLSVCSVPQNFADNLFAVIKRDGVFYLEMMTEQFAGGNMADAVFLDCALTCRGPQINRVCGLEHLEGKTVGILADGAVMASRKVSDGCIRLDSSASVVTVGLEYAADLEVMPLEVMGQDGASVGRKKYVHAADVMFRDTVTAKVGINFDRMEEYKARRTEPYGAAPAPISETKRVVLSSYAQNSVSVCVRSDKPLPMTVLAIMNELEVKAS